MSWGSFREDGMQERLNNAGYWRNLCYREVEFKMSLTLRFRRIQIEYCLIICFFQIRNTLVV